MANTPPEPSGSRMMSRTGPNGLPALDRLVEQAAAMRGDLAKASRARRRDNLIALTLAVVIVALLAMQMAIARQNEQLSRRVADCTTAGGQCYELGRTRTAEAIAELVLADMAVAVCARQPGVDTLPEMERCVRDTLAAG